MSERERWKVSLHGGHCAEFCDHGRGTLRQILEAAVAFGYHTFGVTEHAPRSEERFLYAEERDLGWDVAKITQDFENYAAAVAELAREFEDRLTVLRGFEIEVVPAVAYVEIMRGLRARHNFEYIVGSVHFVDEMQVDGRKEAFDAAVEALGGLEAFAVRYYECVGEMVEALQPEVVGHLDLVRRNAPKDAVLDTPAIRKAAGEALEVIRERGGILDVNTAGYRKGLGSPYPAPWLVALAHDMGVGLCFGDDSHGVDDVGAGLEAARGYLLENGVGHITVLTRREGVLVRENVGLG